MAVWLIILLIVIGIVLLMFEIFFIPGAGFVGIIGMIFMITGVVMSFMHSPTWGYISMTGTLLAIILMLFKAFRPETWRKVALTNEIEGNVDINQAKGLVTGQKGITVSRLAPMGKARFNNRYAEVTAFDSLIDEQTNIEIVRIADNIIYVKSLKI